MDTTTDKSLYAQYLSERLGSSVLETDDGFATYTFIGTTVYIKDIYVVPDKRRTGLASGMADQICELAKDRGCTVLAGSIDPSTTGAHESLLGLLAYGMTISHIMGGLLFLKKDLS